MVNTLISVALTIALAGMLVFVITFTLKAAWRHSALGRHMVYFGWVFSLAIATNLLRIRWPGPAIDVIRVMAVFLLAAVTWQRTYLLFKSLGSTERADKRIHRG